MKADRDQAGTKSGPGSNPTLRSPLSPSHPLDALPSWETQLPRRCMPMSEIINCPSGLSGRIRKMKVREVRPLRLRRGGGRAAQRHRAVPNPGHRRLPQACPHPLRRSHRAQGATDLRPLGSRHQRAGGGDRVALKLLGVVESTISQLAIFPLLVEPARFRRGMSVKFGDVGFDIEKRCPVQDVYPANLEHVALATEKTNN